ncbi:MAG TPA: cytochrome c [Sphingomicrobium sp.]|nr:cytochrome c [Sphingomicrobium sp.]
MRNRLFVAVAISAVLTACGQPDPAERNDTIASANAPAELVAAAEKANVVLGPAVSGEQAMTLMEDRHEGMEDIGDAFKIIGRETKAVSPDVAAIREAAAVIADGADKSSSWFPPGTGPDVGKTRAKAEIWQKPEDFAAKDKAFREAALAFKAAADSGDVNAIKAQAGELAKACKSCHDPYRKPESEHD